MAWLYLWKRMTVWLNEYFLKVQSFYFKTLFLFSIAQMPAENLIGVISVLVQFCFVLPASFLLPDFVYDLCLVTLVKIASERS